MPLEALRGGPRQSDSHLIVDGAPGTMEGVTEKIKTKINRFST